MIKILKSMIALSTVGLFLSSCAEKETDLTDETEVTIVEETKPEIVLTEQEVNDAQQAWCDALVAIGKTYEEGGDYRALALDVLTNAYDYDKGQVFFKPTLTWGEQTFRKSKEGALAYFVGGDENYPNDQGFALKPWAEVWYDNGSRGSEGVMIQGNIGITMGSVHLKDKEGNEIHVDKTFVFKKGEDGVVRLILHKSALPYNP